MNAPEDLNRLYANVSSNIGNAMANILSLNVENKDGKREIGNITDKLRDIQTRFDNELDQLKTHAEWDTFTLAFFGETNAGKSTIIDSLRILFKEESRQALLQQHADDLEQFTLTLNAHLEHVRNGLHALYSEYTDELAAISQSTDQLIRIAQHEAQERNTIVKAEADARTLLAQQEASQRLQIEEANALLRFKVRLALLGGGGILFGATTAAALLKLAGA